MLKDQEKLLQSGIRYSNQKQNAFIREGRSVKEWILSYLTIHAQTFISSLGRLSRSPYSSMMTIIVISVALTLPGGFYLLVENFKKLSGVVETRHDISVFLKQTVSNEVGKGIAKTISHKPWVKDAKLITKEQGLKEFRAYSGFNNALSSLDINPLPVVIQIKPIETINQFSQLNVLIEELENNTNVESVQIDMQWMARLRSIIELVRRGTVLLSLLLGLAVIFIISNTIRLELQTRNEEITVAKLIGATDGFIRRPFLYSGFWYGLLSSLLGLVFINLMIKMLESPVNDVVFLYNSRFQIQGPSIKESLIIVVIGVLLSVIGAWLVCGSHFRQIKTE